MNNDKLSTLNDMHIMSLLPFQLINSDAVEQAVFPDNFKSFYRSSFLFELMDHLESSDHPDGIVLFQLKELFYCAITRLEEDLYLVTAPSCTSKIGTSITFDAFLPYLHTKRIPELKKIMPYFPILATHQLEKFTGLCRQLYSDMPAGPTTVIHNIAKVTDHTLSDAVNELTNANRNAPPRHHTEADWGRLTKAVIDGDPEAYHREASRPMIGQIGQMSLNPLRQAKYGFICAIFATSRAAIEGGLANEFALQLSDTYCQRMDGMTDVDDIHKLTVEVGVDYCRKVEAVKHQNHFHSYTKIALEYIRNHLYEKVSVDDLSFETSLNKRSLSTYFKEDTGLSISDYISKKKLEEAALLLASTNLSLIEISEMLQYSTQSYFGKKFKAEFGITPQVYRDTLST